jgi:hypothetical protein
MKLNKETLKQIIKEELDAVLREDDIYDDEGRQDGATGFEVGGAYDMLGPITSSTTAEEIKKMITGEPPWVRDTVLFQLAAVFSKYPSATMITDAVDELKMSDNFNKHLKFAQR